MSPVKIGWEIKYPKNLFNKIEEDQFKFVVTKGKLGKTVEQSLNKLSKKRRNGLLNMMWFYFAMHHKILER